MAVTWKVHCLKGLLESMPFLLFCKLNMLSLAISHCIMFSPASCHPSNIARRCSLGGGGWISLSIMVASAGLARSCLLERLERLERVLRRVRGALLALEALEALEARAGSRL